MNGSRQNEHRKSKVPGLHWVTLVVVVALIFFLARASGSQEYVPYVKDTGIVQGAEICFSPDLNSESVKLLNTWQRLVNELEAYERGGSPMKEEDAILGLLLYSNNICHTVDRYYNIYITQDTEGYVLAKFDEQYGFDTGTFIVAKKDVMLDRG
jgi:hypothetical protein